MSRDPWQERWIEALSGWQLRRPGGRPSGPPAHGMPRSGHWCSYCPGERHEGCCQYVPQRVLYVAERPHREWQPLRRRLLGFLTRPFRPDEDTA